MILVISSGGCASVMNHYFSSSVDSPTGKMTLAGLKNMVTVSRDEYGIPCRSGEYGRYGNGCGLHPCVRPTFPDDFRKLIAEGRLAEMAGPAVVDLDCFMRAMKVKATVKALYQNLSPENLLLLKDTVRVSMPILNNTRTNCLRRLFWPIISQKPWEPIDSIKIFALVNFGLSFNLYEEIAAINIAQSVGVEK